MRLRILAIPVGASLLLGILALSRPGRVDEEPAPRRSRTAPAVESLVARPTIVVPHEEPAIVPLPPPPKLRREVGDYPRAVNSWFDFESHLSDLGRMRERKGDRWYRDSVLESTAEFLELPSDQVPAFAATLDTVRSELRRIQADMGALMASYPVDLSDQELQRIQSETEDRFRASRDASLSRFDRFLDARDRHREFHAWLGTWMTCAVGLDP